MSSLFTKAVEHLKFSLYPHCSGLPQNLLLANGLLVTFHSPEAHFSGMLVFKQVVPLETLTAEEGFASYMKESNEM